MAWGTQMSDRELTRLRVMIDLADDRLTVDAAATLMGLGRRQIYGSVRARAKIVGMSNMLTTAAIVRS